MPVDPHLGTVLLDRYEIVELISAGGMGLVYRALQRPLGRSVAVKLVHPHLVSHEDVVARFMAEAEITSRLNHPNIVCVHDFGRASPLEGGHLVLVMELLGGRSLQLVFKEDAPLSWRRVVDLTLQLLGALKEAHAHGVVHRDVKPANVVVERERGGRDRAKLIDFGVARVAAGRRITRADQIVGTATYMAPEQAQPGVVGPSADLYAVGVILFQMLTGHVPFRGETALAVISQHAMAPRPDPRRVGPRTVPDGLAEVCLAALTIDPRGRFVSADEFAAALLAASAELDEAPSSRSAAITGSGARQTAMLGAAATRVDLRSVPPPPASVREDEGGVGLRGREDDLAWAAAMIDGGCERGGFVLWGPPGVGRSALLRAIASGVDEAHRHVVLVSARPRPADESVCEGLRLLVASLTGRDALDPALESGDAAGRSEAAFGLRAMFGAKVDWTVDEVDRLRAALSAALDWAIAEARAAARGAPLLVAIDDLDRMDRVSRRVLATALGASARPSVLFVATSAVAPGAFCDAAVPARLLEKLPRALACAEVAARVAALVDPSFHAIEPLYVDQLRAFIADVGEVLPPSRLVDLVGARLLRLSAAARWVVHALTVLGSAPVDEVLALLPDRSTFPEARAGLERSGLVALRGGELSLSHAIIAEIARATAPRGALSALHAAALQLPRIAEGGPELEAHHRLSAGHGRSAYRAADRAAALRAAYGDEEGAVVVLAEGIRVARAAFLDGVDDAEEAWAHFADQTAALLVRMGRADRASAIYNELLDVLAPNDDRRIPLLASLARTFGARGRGDDARDTMRYAVALAQALGRLDLVDGLRAAQRALRGSDP